MRLSQPCSGAHCILCCKDKAKRNNNIVIRKRRNNSAHPQTATAGFVSRLISCTAKHVRRTVQYYPSGVFLFRLPLLTHSNINIIIILEDFSTWMPNSHSMLTASAHFNSEKMWNFESKCKSWLRTHVSEIPKVALRKSLIPTRGSCNCLTSRRPHVVQLEMRLVQGSLWTSLLLGAAMVMIQALPSNLVRAQHPMKTANQAIWSWYPAEEA